MRKLIKPISKISLGSVQWGESYGISNQMGITPIKEISEILKISNKFGIDVIDTAPNYGEAESNLGKLKIKNFKLITKTPKFLNKNITLEDTKLLEQEFFLSLRKLRMKKIYGLLIHQSDDLLKAGGNLLIEKMIELKKNGFVKKVGISIYDSEILEKIFDFFIPDIVQLPINIFDQEIYLSGKLSFLKKNKIEVHARSIFLQGLLLMDHEKLPKYFNRWKNKFLNFETFCSENNITKVQASLNFMRNIDEIDKYILGFNNSYQLKECINSFKNDEITFDFSSFASKDKNLVNPTNWDI